MWDFDDIVRMNAPEEGQKGSKLDHLLRIGAAWPDMLCRGADDLARFGPPYICCFGQLPYPVVVEEGQYALTAIERVPFFLDFHLYSLNVDDNLKLKVESLKGNPETSVEPAPIGTLVRGFVQLWGRRVDRYRNYLECLTDDGVRNVIINPTLYGKKRAPVAYSGEVVTSQTLEIDIARKYLPEFKLALHKFLVNYSAVALEEVPALHRISGYFVMTAPGRIAYSDRPSPILSAMLRDSQLTSLRQISKERINQGLRVGIRQIDRYFRQLLAMQRIAKDGEPELALVGCAAAIEWFMNSFLGPQKRQLSIPPCLEKAPFRDLPETLKERLLTVANSRNGVVHGVPPERETKPNVTSNVNGQLKAASEAIETGRLLYREANLRKWTPQTKT